MLVQNIRYRIKPTPEQVTIIRQNQGNARVYYNMLLDEYRDFLNGKYRLIRKDTKRRESIKRLNIQGTLSVSVLTTRSLTLPKKSIGLINYNITEAKKFRHMTEKEAKNKDGKGYLKLSDSTTLVNVRRNFDRAIKNMFNINTKSKFPRYKRREQYPRTYTSNNIRARKKDSDGFNYSIILHKYSGKNYIKLAKIGLVEIKLHRHVEGELKTVTIIEESTGHFYATLTYETSKKELLPKTGLTTGIDLGITTMVTYSNGDIESNHRHLVRDLSKLQKLQQDLSNQGLRLKKEGRNLRDCKNYQKNRQRLAKLHSHIANSRKDSNHKISKKIVSTYDIICIEDLDIRGMLKSETKQAKAINILDVGWGELLRYIKYKSLWYGKECVTVGRYFPSSKLCSTIGCGYITDTLDTSVRGWECPNCGTHHDRDVNAAINIEREGLRLYRLSQ